MAYRKSLRVSSLVDAIYCISTVGIPCTKLEQYLKLGSVLRILITSLFKEKRKEIMSFMVLRKHPDLMKRFWKFKIRLDYLRMRTSMFHPMFV